MIVIRVELQAKSDKQQDLVQYMDKSMDVSRQFNGCAKFNLYQDSQQEDTFLLYEEWETKADFDAFCASEHFQKSGKDLAPMLAGKPDSIYFDAHILQ